MLAAIALTILSFIVIAQRLYYHVILRSQILLLRHGQALIDLKVCRHHNIDLIDNNRAKAEALQNLISSVEALLAHDIDHTLDTLVELDEKQFFAHHTLLDANAVDAITDWSTLESMIEQLEVARREATT